MAAAPNAGGGFIRTVRGDIGRGDAGYTHCHEHTFILPGPHSAGNPARVLDDLDRTVAELSEFYAAGGRTVVDAQAIGPQRAPRLDFAASERSGVNIVAATGFLRAADYTSDHFCFHESAEILAERIVEEITVGMSEYRGGEMAGRTEIRAGLIKFASGYHLIDAHAEKLAEAAAIAHARSGAPILTHTEHGTCALEQILLFRRLGVAPSALLISHLDRNPDFQLHEEIADSGAYLIYDGVSRITLHPDSTIVNLICRMAEAGHTSRILLGMDMGERTMWRSYGGGPGMSYLPNVFLRRLRMAGLGNEQVMTFTEYNPSAALAFRVHAA